MMKPLYMFLLWLFGWKVKGHFPNTMKKYIIAVAPHTSNWDFLVGVAARSILNLHGARFLGKSQLFKPPFGWFFRWIGGYPVDRSKSHDMVEQVASIFNSHERFVLAIAPEGTRKKVNKLKTGFYYIAKKTGVPIIPTGFDYKFKQIVIGTPLFTSNDFDLDMQKLIDFYQNITGKNPELGIAY
jgi:1-acyl-sn-glycerol-3-phosphate acyltransferase